MLFLRLCILMLVVLWVIFGALLLTLVVCYCLFDCVIKWLV